MICRTRWVPSGQRSELSYYVNVVRTLATRAALEQRFGLMRADLSTVELLHHVVESEAGRISGEAETG